MVWGKEMAIAAVRYSVVHGDATQADVDVLALKHAQQFSGLERHVAERLATTGQDLRKLDLAPGGTRIVDALRAVAAPAVLFVGTASSLSFGYSDVRKLASDTLRALGAARRPIRSVGTSLHGPGFGLDEEEAALAQLGGCLDALQVGDAPAGLEEIRVLEIDRSRCERIWSTLERTPASGRRLIDRAPDRRVWALEAAGWTSRTGEPPTSEWAAGLVVKPHAFVAMPFATEMEDVYYFGIHGPVRGHGLVCERIDQEVFTGDIVEQIKRRIDSAAVVIADLSRANPNVYLEVGYAWGRARPCVLLIRDGEEPRFDVRGIRHIRYTTIRELAALLDREVGGLLRQGVIAPSR